MMMHACLEVVLLFLILGIFKLVVLLLAAYDVVQVLEVLAVLE